MGVLRRSVSTRRARRTAGVVAGVVVGVGAMVACEPGTLSAATVSYTTDQLVTKELERQRAQVQWLSCVADFGDRGTPSPSASENTVADVDCEGQTDDGRDIEVTGKVTRAVSGACVRGDLTAKIDGRQLFHVTGLGDCDATSAPPADLPGGGPTTTVTVTKTVYCQSDPQCWPDGK
ncbi:hypothetical protein ACIQAC_04215 [Streptomyces sp. NPDC088387]|uniref:hypothetical protein n=1 Tax=Streptomyces sp. NPDC088387 TaxID=3365859 RepID=UPI00382DE37B